MHNLNFSMWLNVKRHQFYHLSVVSIIGLSVHTVPSGILSGSMMLSQANMLNFNSINWMKNWFLVQISGFFFFLLSLHFFYIFDISSFPVVSIQWCQTMSGKKPDLILLFFVWKIGREEVPFFFFLLSLHMWINKMDSITGIANI